ncbi:MAG: UDP-3-O-(3-hydroxymyristoyl)glucosamine N-acyltransferase, partial [Flavisolibacter sp.]|nr:UDP-3-O-(3-hydroxymyristoyl)glucosamine N-acyltransferase [Flavisolibacter sp.]
VGGQVAIVEHVEIADGSKIGAKSKVTKNFREKNSNINGDPAFDYARSLKSQAVYRNLPELEKRVKDLELKSKTDAGTAGK